MDVKTTRIYEGMIIIKVRIMPTFYERETTVIGSGAAGKIPLLGLDGSFKGICFIITH